MTKYLVTGASGQLGTLVIRHLIDTEGVAPGDIVAGARDTGKLTALAKEGVETRKVDFDDPNLAGKLGGVDRMLLISTDAIDPPGTRLRQHSAAIAAAKAAGVGHVIYTSMPNPATALVTFAPDHAGSEKALAASGMGYTVLRNSWYAENLLMSLPQALASGQMYSASGDGRTAYVTREDCARAAAAALARGPDGNSVLTITGQDAVSNADLVGLVKDVLGKDVAVVDLPGDALEKGMLDAGLPAPLAKMLVSFDLNTKAGGVGEVSGDFAALTGKAPTSFKTYFQDNKAAFAA